MAAEAEAGAHDAVADRLAHQELLRALAGLVVVVDDAVVGRLVAVEFLGLAADGQRGEQHFVAFAPRLSSSPAIQHLERVAGLRLALEVDVVRVDADQVVDDRARHLVAQRGLVDALIEPHRRGRRSRRPRRLRRLRSRSPCFAHRPRRICRCRRARRRLRRRYRRRRSTRTTRRRSGGGRREQDAQLLAFAQAAVAAARAEHRGDRLMSSGEAPRSRRIVASDRPSSPRRCARSRRSARRSARWSSAAA